MKLRHFLIGAVIWILPFIGFAISFERDLYFGIINDPEVTRLQEFLQKEGVYDGPVTGNFLALTREGVKNFQRREGIEPVEGYFGPLSRGRANEIFSQRTAGAVTLPAGSRAEQTAFLQAKITELIKQLEELQRKLAEEEKSAEPPPDTAPPVFAVAPYVKSKGFVSERPFGAKFPYRVILDWEVGGAPASESVICSPDISKMRKAADGSTEYFPEPDKSYSCAIIVSDVAGNQTLGTALFTSPTWVSAAELWTAPSFSDTEENPFKIGEFAVYNGTTTSVLFANVEMIITDDMDSADNRDREVTFLLRDGKTAIDTLIGKKKFTFSINHPATIGVPHKASLVIPFDILLAKGEEKLVSLWVEQFKFVRNGTLKITATKIETVGPSVEGSFDFVLTKEPPL